METETDDDLLVCSMWPSGSLSGSICSSISMHSDHNVEEYIGDAPFAGEWTRTQSEALPAPGTGWPPDRKIKLRKNVQGKVGGNVSQEIGEHCKKILCTIIIYYAIL